MRKVRRLLHERRAVRDRPARSWTVQYRCLVFGHVPDSRPEPAQTLTMLSQRDDDLLVGRQIFRVMVDLVERNFKPGKLLPERALRLVNELLHQTVNLVQLDLKLREAFQLQVELFPNYVELVVYQREHFGRTHLRSCRTSRSRRTTLAFAPRSPRSARAPCTPR